MSDSAPPPPPPPPPGNPYGSPAGPYGAPGGAQPASLLPRFAARLLDGIIVGVVSLIVTFILGAAIGGYASTAISAIIGAAIYLGYFVYLESANGQTVGKMALSLHVVGPDGTSKPTTNEALKRNLWTALGVLGVLGTVGSYLGSVLELIAVIVIAVTINSDTVRRQSWFDTFAGGTQVLTKS